MNYAHGLLMPGGELIVGNLADNDSKTMQGRPITFCGTMLLMQQQPPLTSHKLPLTCAALSSGEDVDAAD